MIRLRLLILIALLAVGAGCGRRSPTPTSGSALGNRVLTTATTADVRTLDPALAYDTWSIAAVHAITRRLVDYDREGSLTADLAETWSTSDDGMVFTFRLRSADYADGSPIVAQDFVDTLERLRDPATDSNARDFYASIARIEAVDDRTLRFTLQQLDPTFPAVLGMTFFAPTPRRAVEAAAAAKRPYGDQPLASGPFTLAEHRRGQELILARNPRDDRAETNLDRLVLKVQMREDSQMLAFESGQLDLLTGLSLADYATVLDDPARRTRVVQAPVSQTWYFGMNVTRPPFNRALVRQAVVLAIDREKQARLGPGGVAASGILPPGVPGHDADRLLPERDVARAKALLAQAGYPRGIPASQAPTMWLANDELYQRRAEAVQADLREVGIPVTLRAATMSEYLTAYKNDADCWYGGWFPDFPDAGNFLEPLFHSRNIKPRNSLNATHYRNGRVDALLDQAGATPAGEPRNALYRQAEELILKDAPWAPLYFEVETRYYRPSVQGVVVHPIWRQILTPLGKAP